MGLLVISFMIGKGFFAAAMIGFAGAIVGSIISTRLMQTMIKSEFHNIPREVPQDLEENVSFKSKGHFSMRFLNATLDGGKAGVDLGLAIIPGVLIISTAVMILTLSAKDPSGVYSGAAYEGVPVIPYLANKIGWGLLDEVIENLSEEKYKNLLCGSTFEYCGKKQKHFGLKRVLVYYAYGLYKYSGNYIDTAHGTVYKSVSDSVPVDDKILTKLRNEYFNLANEYWRNVEKYLCANKETFTEFDTCNCECECGGCEEKTRLGKSRLRKIKTFKKYGNSNNY